MSKRVLLAGIVMCAAAPLNAASDAALKFGAREHVQQISLSPDGNHVAFIQPTGPRGAEVTVLDVRDGSRTTAASSSGSPDRLRYCHWSTNIRLVCGAYLIQGADGQDLGFSRMVSVDLDGKNLKMLSAISSQRSLAIDNGGGNVIDWLGETGDGSVLMTRTFLPQFSTGTRMADPRSGFGVERVDTTSLRRNVVEDPHNDAVEFITDGHGAVRIMGQQRSTEAGYDKNVVKYLYRHVGGQAWQELSRVTLVGGRVVGFDPYAVDRDHDLAYGFDTLNGHTALFSVALDGTGKREAVLSRPDVDIDSLIRIGRQRRVVGASFATDRRVTTFFDPELKNFAASLAKALPDLPLISFVDADAEERKLLLFAGSDVDPGHYYLFDKGSRKLDEVTAARPQLSDVKLATVQAVSYPAADGTQIPAYLTLPPGRAGKNLPTIVMPHGGPEARDEWGFDWLAQFFANRGFAVLQPNFRGSAGYGDAWFKDNGFKSWRTAVGDVDDGGRWLVKQGLADPAKLAIFGWSYGGYAALQSSVLDPTLFKAIVAVAPITDLEALRNEHMNLTDFDIEDARIGRGPHVREGSPAQNAARIAAPVLLFHGDRDVNVGIGGSRLMASRLKAAGKTVELVEFHNLDHQLDDSVARAALLDKSDGFLRAALGMTAGQ